MIPATLMASWIGPCRVALSPYCRIVGGMHENALRTSLFVELARLCLRAPLIKLKTSAWRDTQIGVENLEQFKKDLLVERDATDVNRVNVLPPPDLINQFRVFAGQVQFRL